jgi:hypothetical protein
MFTRVALGSGWILQALAQTEERELVTAGSGTNRRKRVGYCRLWHKQKKESWVLQALAQTEERQSVLLFSCDVVLRSVRYTALTFLIFMF